MARGDIDANEVYADQEMLNRLGYGIFDVTFGKSGVGFENVKDFSYVIAQDKDPKLYRGKVYDLIGRYFSNKLAKAVWDEFINHKWVLSERAGYEVDLQTAARDWFEQHGHDFLKTWTFRQEEIPNRIRNEREPQRGSVSLVTGLLIPHVRELLKAGFSVGDVAWAALREAVPSGVWKSVDGKTKRRRLNLTPRLPHRKAEKESDPRYYTIKKLAPEDLKDGLYYVRLVAKLTGHEPQSPEEAERRWHEILEHKWYLSERAGHDVGLRVAALDYFRRLNLLQEVETGHEN